jgi:hypothetical protein
MGYGNPPPSWHVACTDRDQPGTPGILECGRHVMGEDTKNLVVDAKNYVIQAIRGVGDVAGAIADATTGALTRALRGTRATGSEFRGLVAETVTGTLQGVALVGGEVEASASSIMMGALRGANRIGKFGVDTVTGTASALVRGAADVGGDIARTAKGAVEGAIHNAREVGLTAEQAASAAATGALIGAGEISNVAMDQVRDVVTKTISGVKVVITEPFRSDLSGGTSHYAR